MDINIEAMQLENFCKKVYQKCGMAEADAAQAAEYMVRTSLWGVDSHGIMRLPVYAKRLLSGAVKARPEFKPVKDQGGPLALYDGDAGLGYTVGKYGMELAIKKALDHGIGFVLVNNSNHYGAAALYSRMAEAKGLIGISTTNVIPNIGLKGQLKPSTGNNPIALSAPTYGEYPFTLDISLSAVAGGKLLLAAKQKKKIPVDWAVSKDGLETDDPEVGFAGFLLSMGMHKGFGLSLFVDLLTGLLSGGPFLKDLRSMYSHPDKPSLTSQLFIALDPGFFLDPETYKEKIREWIRMIRSVPMVDPESSQLIPGEMEYKTSIERQKSGIPLPEEVLKELKSLGVSLGIILEEC
jgi:LDH2 family malate/lactate/ureidoglycolate dehydrogenase